MNTFGVAIHTGKTAAAVRGAARVKASGFSDTRGAALVTSLVILLVLTILGLAAMSTSSLEEKMSGNIQDSTFAFEAAESGLNKALTTAGALSLSGTTTNSFDFDGGKSGSASVQTVFLQYSPPKRGTGYGSNFDVANFDQTSTGTTTSGAKAVIHQGVGQVVPKAN